MHIKCIQNRLLVSQETVRMLLHILDPEGIAIRRARRLRRRRYASKGPNWVWHLDGYDKLKPYGISIHGCIDGFSRYMLWLEAYYTNSKPTLVAGYFMMAVQLHRGCPAIVRADRGTENGHVEVMQKAMTGEHADPEAENRSFIYGRSIANQRIESWWSMLRKQCSQHWINVFSTLRDEGAFSADFLDKNLICFCFLRLVQVGMSCIYSYLIRIVMYNLSPRNLTSMYNEGTYKDRNHLPLMFDLIGFNLTIKKKPFTLTHLCKFVSGQFR